MKYKIPLVKNSFYNNKATLHKMINFLQKNKKLTMCNECSKFEEAFCKFQKCDFAVFFSSGSTANLALLQSLKNLKIINEGDNIAISSLTWSTNVMPIIQLSMNPIPIDVDLKNLNINIEDFKEKHKKFRFKAIFLTNALSFTCDLEKLRDYCIKNAITLIEDNCESMGTEFKNTKAGNFGLASTFSFFVGHQMSTIEGRMVATSNERLYQMLKIVQLDNIFLPSLYFLEKVVPVKKFTLNKMIEMKSDFYIKKVINILN